MRNYRGQPEQPQAACENAPCSGWIIAAFEALAILATVKAWRAETACDAHAVAAASAAPWACLLTRTPPDLMLAKVPMVRIVYCQRPEARLDPGWPEAVHEHLRVPFAILLRLTFLASWTLEIHMVIISAAACLAALHKVAEGQASTTSLCKQHCH